MKLLKINLGIVIVAAALVVLLISELPVPFLADVVRTRVEAATGHSVLIGGPAKLRIWPSPTLTISDLTLRDDNDPARLKAETVRVALSFDGLLAGRPKIVEIAVARPVLRVPLLRQRRAGATASSGASGSAPGTPFEVDRVVIQDGAIVFSSSQEGFESHIDQVNIVASLAAKDDRPNVAGSLVCGGQMVRAEIKADGLRELAQGRPTQVEIALQAPGLVAEAVAATAELRLRSSVLSLNRLSGQFGQSRFNGWTSVDFAAGKPVVKGEVDFNRLQIAPATAARARGASQAAAAGHPWSEQDVDVRGLNFFDAEVLASTSELVVDSFRFAPIAVAASIDRGRLEARVMQAKAYGGEINGTFAIDASGAVPRQAMNLRIDRVGALPLLSELADFTWLEGDMQALLDFEAGGANQLAVVSTLAGTADIRLSNGAIRGIDIAKLMREVSKNILDGWQQSASDKTELADLTAAFRIQNGIATTDSLQLAGPVVRVAGRGTVDLPRRTLQFRVNPQLAKGVGGAAEPTDLGVAVVLQGPWSEPRIYPDIAGILEDPDRAYARLRALGSGLLGETGRTGSDGIDRLIKGIGDMFNIPLKDQKPFGGSRR
jgi:AsmA protein